MKRRRPRPSGTASSADIASGRGLGARSLSVLLALACLLPGCSETPPARRDVVIGLVGEPSSVLAEHPSARVLAAAVTETLVRRNARDEYVARLAEEVPTLENGGLRIVLDDPDAPGGRLVATYRLRADLTWQDGRPITAGDVRFAWDEDRAAPPSSDARVIADRVSIVEVLSERTVRFVYRPGERWDAYPLAPRVMPRHILAGASAEARAAYERAPVHAGPFSVAAWLPSFGVTLAAFPGYFDGPPGLGRIEVRFFRERGALVDALGRGEVDVAPAPGLELDLSGVLARIADGTARTPLETYYVPAQSLDVLRFGARFGDLRVRRAIELAIDRQAIVDDVFAGRARVPRSYLVPPLWAAADLGQAAPADRDRARALLAAAGYRPGNFGILQAGGERLVVTLAVASGSPARLEAARLVAGHLAAVGIAAEVREEPAGRLAELSLTGAFDLAIAAESASDPQLATDRYLGRAGPWFDVLAAAARGATDRAERRALYAELQRIWAEAPAAVPLYQHLSVDVAPRGLAGIQPTSHLAPLTWNVAAWRFSGT